MIKSKKAKFGLISIAVATVLVLASVVSCGVAPTPAEAPAETGGLAKPSPSILVAPLVNAPRDTAWNCYGVDFEPGETLKAGIPIRRVEGTPAILTFFGPGGAGRSFQADDDGNFILENNKAPKNPGAYSVRIYNKDLTEVRATAIIVVKAAE